MTNPYTATNEEAGSAALRRDSAPPSEPSERDYARVSRRASGWVTCGFAPLDRRQAECKGRVAALDRHGQFANALRLESEMIWGPWRLTLDRAYQQDSDGHWQESPRAAHRLELGREVLGRQVPMLHFGPDPNLGGGRIPTIPAWIRCRTCNHWRRLDADRLGVGHTDNLGHT